MLQPDSLIFDLDGTLWDSCPACATGWNNVLSRNHIDFRKIEADDVRKVAGKQHEQCIEEVFGGQLPQEQIDIISQETKSEDSKVIEKQGALVYPGVQQGLLTLQARFPLFIVSNCQSGYIETFFKLTGLGPLFVDFECYGNTNLPKPQNIQSVIKRNKLKSSVYIGDTWGDHTAAKENEIPFYFMNYGFGAGVPSHYEFDSFSELVTFLSE